ncbi:AarF/ABC1/UbiB kinase family protein [Chryseobacterium sp. MDT2-18]|uniref:ABC1 kinase family protein n=1 Tax=Chryseobacterium sp. MDT2-18 TaxID=1259136 RepID=UPI00277E52E4|nr:lipopolysaccharide core heptose(II) kinase RfaY [Chryseobacterium sp. MDT2-18]MDQ0477707.1 putative unusual protein kinase regulating ubiquinone biosynthesis (AarF/ABC1/UbiB family) [Chryseobacterium sp. MDT2-18]
MKTLDKIPTSKIQRAGKLISTGAKVGVNYLKYYGEKITKTEDEAKDNLNKNNATDIYDSLKELKGSALKVAQMLSMEKNILPAAYVEKFSLSQFQVPPLSAPLVTKIFKTYFGKRPNELFDEFEPNSTNAASIGQVHKAKKDGKELAVKIQYPGVSDSISSDLAMVKPIAMKMFNIKGKNSDQYFKEVEDKLLEETDYNLEISQSLEIRKSCESLPNLAFPDYYPQYSNDRIITMDWMHGIHLSTFCAANQDPKLANKVGQALWDFYMFQIHQLRKVHADPHPGNFLVSEEGTLIAIDFGCMKGIPEDFYIPYFELAIRENLENKEFFDRKLLELEIIRPDDSAEEKEFFTQIFYELLYLFTTPFQEENFDFSDGKFFQAIADLGQKYAKNTQIKGRNANRGSRHFIYMNRTFFGLYNLMHDIKANHILINNYKNFIKN